MHSSVICAKSTATSNNQLHRHSLAQMLTKDADDQMTMWMRVGSGCQLGEKKNRGRKDLNFV